MKQAAADVGFSEVDKIRPRSAMFAFFLTPECRPVSRYPAGKDEDGRGMWWCAFEGVGLMVTVEENRLNTSRDMVDSTKVLSLASPVFIYSQNDSLNTQASTRIMPLVHEIVFQRQNAAVIVKYTAD